MQRDSDNARPAYRVLRDPKAIRALAHPLRLALLEVLGGEGTATATRCAEVTGESVASCSFHLRALAQHGMIERALSEGRERPWRLAAPTQMIEPTADEQISTANAALMDFFLDHEVNRIRTWRDRQENEAPPWRDAGHFLGATAWLTVDELARLHAELNDVVERFFLDRLAEDSRRPEARPVRLLLATSVGLSNGTA